MAARNDVASFTINFTLPPEVIKAYFDGQAKVEAAKSKNSSSGFSEYLPLITALLPTLLSSNKTQTSTRQSKGSQPEVACVPVTKFEEPEQAKSEQSKSEQSKSEAVVIEVKKVDTIEPVDEIEKLVEESRGSTENDNVLDDMQSASSASTSTSSGQSAQSNEGINGMLSMLTGVMESTGDPKLGEMMKGFLPILQGFTTGFAGGSKMIAGASEPSKKEEVVQESSQTKETESSEVAESSSSEQKESAAAE